MNNKELTSLAIRVFAIYVLVQAIILIAQMGSSYSSFFQGNDKWLFIIPILSFVGLVFVFGSLWKLSGSIYKSITAENETNEKFKVDQLFILNLVGLYLFVDALLGLASGGLSLYFLYFYQASEFGSNYNPEMNAQNIFYIIASGLKLIVGITLLIKPHGWAKLFYKFRTFGLSKK